MMANRAQYRGEAEALIGHVALKNIAASLILYQ